MVQTTQSVLTESQRRAAEEDGYFVVEGLVSPATCQRFIQRLDDYAHTRRPLPTGLSVQREPRVARGTLQAAPGEDVRKISGVARGDDLFGALVVQPEIVRIIQELTSPNVKLFRADVLMKPAGVGSAKGMHQDSPYWPIEPMALWSCWLPFDPSLLENGCMTAIPGSHKRGPLPHVRVTDDYIIPDGALRTRRRGRNPDGAGERTVLPQPAAARHGREPLGAAAAGDHDELHGHRIALHRPCHPSPSTCVSAAWTFPAASRPAWT